MKNHKIKCNCSFCKTERGEMKKENSPNWRGGRTYQKCITCGKKLNRNSYSKGNKRCHKCATKGKLNPFFGKHHSPETLKIISQRVKLAVKNVKFNKHHLNLNPQNNKDKNIYILSKSHHQLFHRLAYHYLLEKFGIKEILKYKKWFIKKYERNTQL